MVRGSLVLAWYAKLSSRLVDLVGDFAGANLFLLEGDSLLLTIFSDPGLDFHSGFQLLHAVYSVELFLKKLVDRNCRFKLVFFDHHAASCVPPGPEAKGNKNKFLLAREVIIRHLRASIDEHGVELHDFRHVQDQRFLSFLSEQDVYFFMCHDGAGISLPSTEESEESKPDSRAHFRAFIWRYVLKGYHVALINESQFKGSKVAATLYVSSLLTLCR